MKFIFVEYNENFQCSLCKNKFKEGYVPQPTTNEEFDKLEQIFEQDISDWFACEDCVNGFCGAVPDSQPNEWLERKWRLIKNRNRKI